MPVRAEDLVRPEPSLPSSVGEAVQPWALLATLAGIGFLVAGIASYVRSAELDGERTARKWLLGLGAGFAIIAVLLWVLWLLAGRSG